MMSPQSQLRYSPYSLPVVSTCLPTPPPPPPPPHLSPLQQQAAMAPSFSLPMVQTLQSPLEMSAGSSLLPPGMLMLPAKQSRTVQQPSLGYNVNDLINIQNLQRQDTSVQPFSFPLG